MRRRTMDEWQCIIQDAYPAYISWTQYLANRARLSANVTRFRESTNEGRGRRAKARPYCKAWPRAVAVGARCMSILVATRATSARA